MTAFQAYQLYNAIRMHFTGSYDFFKYNGKTGVKESSFQIRKDQYHYEKLARFHDPRGLLVANFVEKEKPWIRDIVSDSGKAVYATWAKRAQAITYTIKADLHRLSDDFDSNFKCVDGEYCPLLRMLTGPTDKRVAIETVCVLAKMLGVFRHWNSALEADPYWRDILGMKLQKYTPFIQFDQQKIKQVILEHFGARRPIE